MIRDITPFQTAANCRHYAMCKIDFLDTGICQPALEVPYVSYFPQGRMDLYAALERKTIPVTEELVRIVDSCTLCGICDKQCHFVTELRPLTVMNALKDHVKDFLEQGGVPEKPEPDEPLRDLRAIVGEQWASNDPAILLPYSDDPCPISMQTMPKYAALPGTKEEVAAIMKLCTDRGLPFAVRGNGSSVMGFVFSDGLVLDMQRMQKIDFDEENWKVDVGPGVSAFTLQQEAVTRKFRVNVAEPSALVCANMMCSGIFSNFSHSYGTLADNIVDAEFVDREGRTFRTSQPDAPNLYGYEKADKTVPAVCTEVSVKLHPLPDDEEGILVPFETLEEALRFSRELGVRRIGNAVGVLGGEYLSVFISPATELAYSVKDFFTESLGIKYLVLVLADRYDRDIVRDMGVSIIDQKLFSTLMLALPMLKNGDIVELIGEYEGNQKPYELLSDPDLLPVIESLLESSPETLAGSVPDDLEDFYTELYRRPEMTDLVWLSMFRIISSRMGRFKHVVAFIVYMPLDKPEIIEAMNKRFKEIGDKHGIHHDYGFVTPLDMGKRAVFEYDFYVDQTDEDNLDRGRAAMGETAAMIEEFSARCKGVRWIRYTLYQGFTRPEHILYID